MFFPTPVPKVENALSLSQFVRALKLKNSIQISRIHPLGNRNEIRAFHDSLQNLRCLVCNVEIGRCGGAGVTEMTLLSLQWRYLFPHDSVLIKQSCFTTKRPQTLSNFIVLSHCRSHASSVWAGLWESFVLNTSLWKEAFHLLPTCRMKPNSIGFKSCHVSFI